MDAILHQPAQPARKSGVAWRLATAAAMVVLGVLMSVFPRPQPDLAETPAARATRAKLGGKLRQIWLDGVPLEAALRQIERLANVRIEIDADTVAPATDRLRGARVTCRLRDVRYDRALETFLANTAEVQWLIDDDGTIRIMALEAMSKRLVTKVYDVSDLIFDTRPLPRDRQMLFEEVERLIVEVVDPASWRAGGGWGEIRWDEHGRLVVENTRENVRLTESLLGHLRETRGYFQIHQLLTNGSGG